MRSILRRLSRSHGTAVAYLALFAALGGRHSHRHDPPADPHWRHQQPQLVLP